MNNFLIAVNCILPVFLIMSVGIAVKHAGMVNDETTYQMNNLVFRIFLPIMIFNSVYHTSLGSAFNPNLLWFIVASVLVAFLLAVIFVISIEKAPEKRGVMVQAIFRSNFLILGMPIVESLFGAEKVGMTAVSVAVVVPMFNILAVIALETFRYKTFNFKKVLHGIVTNPLIWGCIAGLLALNFKLSLPGLIERTLDSLASIGTPFALVCLGASLHFDQINGRKLSIAICVFGKLFAMPAIMLPIAIAFGFRDVELGTIMAVFASPTAVSSFVMAQQSGGDGELAGEAVVFTSVVSCVSIIMWTFILKQLGYF